MLIGVDHSYTDRTEYRFCVIDDNVYLETMSVMTRESRRHKFVTDKTKSYSRLNSRDYGIKKEPDIPIEVAVEAVRYYRNRISFKKWNKL